MKYLLSLTLVSILTVALGCGGGDPNKGLKPIDPAGAAPKMVDEKTGGTKDKPATPP